ncbi:RsmE family RNA methyltransferase [Geoalkalibacter halelectricus]|uniref:Ribosomal RNA small subunit methyltransferase E n=1 Tax=Geoalkalibacter halelectricus TaxID=2847045 RepID=A0ABY5ZQB8_9BACT|nr:RsmE family RNA methyltransferase [Geoalkalibacter halelectricus]MDO3376691.1 16S rRNA (uracil(1498)-N(3))-methyltransferase [Geoalkalibacter halelectricus]UWZ81357.1 16S rRNA (uracil(1498)-N(3))-methyltransferase [Geoalkalibacter halelectricus]
MHPACVNGGGPLSRIELAVRARLQHPVLLEGPTRHALESWQARCGEALTVIDGEGRGFRARVVECAADKAVLLPFEELTRIPESPVRIEVYQALPQRERFELILQKLTEIGVARIVPFESSRSITRQERDAGQKKSHRWPQVVLKAAKQCRRAIIPELLGVQSFAAALYEAHHADLRFFFYEGSGTWSLREALAGGQPRRLALVVGPEGGFSAQEYDEMRALDLLPVSLGPRILRTETAAMVGAAVVQHVLGDLY